MRLDAYLPVRILKAHPKCIHDEVLCRVVTGDAAPSVTETPLRPSATAAKGVTIRSRTHAVNRVRWVLIDVFYYESVPAGRQMQ